MNAKAELLHKSKLILNSGLVREIVIWKVPESMFYPEGIKYRLLLVDPLCKKVFVLFDNHAPKGHHWHDTTGTQYHYRFVSVRLLISDYLRLELALEKHYESNENKNSK